MLTEVAINARPNGATRWFTDDYFDLYLWPGPDGALTGFQLCYDKERNEHALTWTVPRGLVHHEVDPGDDSPFENKTPILLPDGEIPFAAVRAEFAKRAGALDPELRAFISARLIPAPPRS